MEKRLLLAFGLMFVVLIGWNLVMGPQQGPPPVEGPAPPAAAPATGTPATGTSGGGAVAEEAEEPVTASTWGTPPTHRGAASSRADLGEATGEDEARGPAGAWLAESSEERGRIIEVSTDLFVAEIDPVGGDILSWRLRRFQTQGGRPVQLVTDRSLDGSTQTAHALRLLVGDRRLDLRQVTFEASAAALELRPERPTGEVVLRADRPGGGHLELTYAFDNARYGFDVTVEYRPGRDEPPPVAWEVAWPGGIANSEPDTVNEYNEYRAVARVGADIHKKSYMSLRKNGGTKGRASYEGTVSWAGVVSKYFTTLVIAAEARGGSAHLDGDFERRLQTFAARLPLEGGRPATVAYSVYIGPLDYDSLAPYGAEVTRLIQLGPAIFRPVARFTLSLLKLMHRVLPNYGWVIVLLSVATKFLFYPLTKSSTQSMRKMQQLQPQLQRLREKYKDDRQKQNEAMMALYRKEGVNPIGGCLPLVIQMPVFWALFTVLRRTIELRQAPWIGWIDDLSRPDVLFRLPVSLPVLGDKFCLLPILMAAGMWLQSKLSAPVGGGSDGGAMASQTRMMGTMMPIFMFVVFYNSPSGLVLYWLVNTVLTAFQTWKIHREMAPTVELTPDPKAA